jgi:hypothetical protein
VDLSLLETLKQKLITAKQFSAVFNYFLDHFGHDPEFIAQGERTHSPFLEAVLTEVGKQLFGKPVPLADVLLTRLPGHGFIHGACKLGGHLANVLYFEDGRIGLLAVIESYTSPETKLVRFSGRSLQGTPTPSTN